MFRGSRLAARGSRLAAPDTRSAELQLRVAGSWELDALFQFVLQYLLWTEPVDLQIELRS
jgi:hypothetical protein